MKLKEKNRLTPNVPSAPPGVTCVRALRLQTTREFLWPLPLDVTGGAPNVSGTVNFALPSSREV